jgi:hypothetical protein
VQLPFLQSTLDHFTILPIAVGDADPAQVAAVLEALWGGPETLIVISSDLSHYHPYRQAQFRDKATIAQIRQLDATLDGEQACGAGAINGLLLAARATTSRRICSTCATRATPPATAAAWSATPPSPSRTTATMPTTDTQLGQVLLAQARKAIADALGLPAPRRRTTPARRARRHLRHPHLDELRGCIGSLNAHRPLGQDVRDNAVAAALRDPRFPPLSAAEFARCGSRCRCSPSPISSSSATRPTPSPSWCPGATA